MKLMLISVDADRVRRAQEAGIDRIFIDLEKNGKEERQKNLNTYVPGHTFEDIVRMKQIVTDAEILARVNPYYEKTEEEVDICIENGADIIMLPMFTEYKQVEGFVQAVRGRVKTCLLLETPQALCRIREILTLDGIDELYIGLNDLSLGMGLKFLFEPLAGGLVDFVAAMAKNRGIEFGFGGLARMGAGLIPGEDILAENYRIGTDMVILSQAFDDSPDVKKDIEQIRKREEELEQWSRDMFEEKHRENCRKIYRIVNE